MKKPTKDLLVTVLEKLTRANCLNEENGRRCLDSVKAVNEISAVVTDNLQLLKSIIDKGKFKISKTKLKVFIESELKCFLFPYGNVKLTQGERGRILEEHLDSYICFDTRTIKKLFKNIYNVCGADNNIKDFVNDPHKTTLDTLSIYVGYLGYGGFTKSISLHDKFESETIIKYSNQVLKTRSQKNDLLVLSFEGDEANSLKIDLISSLYEHLDKSLNINIKKSNEKIDYANSPKDGHDQAREIGKKHNVAFVIWGHIVQTKQKVFPRITIVEKNIGRFFIDGENFTIPFVINYDYELPPELIEKPKLLANFIKGFYYYKRFNNKLALRIFKNIEKEIRPNELRITSLHSILGSINFYLFANNKMEKEYYNNSIAYYNKVISVLPNEFDVYRDLGFVYALNKEYEIGIKYIEKAMDEGNSKREGFELLGFIYHYMGKNAISVKYFEKAVKENSDPGSPNTMRNLSIIYRNQRKFKKSEEWIKKAIKLKPNDDNLLNDLGNLYLEEKKHEEALNFYKKALETNDINYKTWNNLGILYQELGDKNEALKCFNKSLKINKNFYDALVNIGDYYRTNGEFDKAFKFLIKAIRTGSLKTEVYNVIGIVFTDLGNLWAGIKYFMYATRHKYAYSVWFNIGKNYEELGFMDNALECYNRAIKLNPEFYDGFIALGSLLNKKHNNTQAINHSKQAKAIDCFKRAININPNYWSAYNKLADIYFSNGNISMSISLYEEFINIDSVNNDLAWNSLGSIYCQTNNYNEAIRCLLKAIDLNESAVEAWEMLGNTYGMIEDFERSINAYENSLRINDQRIRTWINLGITFMRMKVFDKAIPCFEKASEIKPDDNQVWNYLGFSYSKIGDTENELRCQNKILELQKLNNLNT